MTRLRNAALLAFALLVPPVSASLEVHDTLLSSVPWTSIETIVAKARKGVKTDPSSLRIDKDRGVARARLTLSSGDMWTFWDSNPFARHGHGIVSLGLSAKVQGNRLLVPRETAAAAKLRPVERAPKNVETSSAIAKASATAPLSAATDTPAIRAPAETTRVVPAATPEDSVKPTPLPTDALDTSGKSSPTDDSAAPTQQPKASKSVASTPPISDIKGEDGIFTVVLDAGHGGKDPGAVGKKVDDKALQEKDAALGIALKLRDELRSYKDIRVVMTRDDDEFLKLNERTRVANEKKGDLFVSLHCNSLPLNSSHRDEVEGFMVYLLREAKSDADRAIERRENDVIRYETGERQRKESLSPVEWVMLEHQLNLYTKESERFAGIVVKNLEAKSPMKKERTGAGQAGFFVLVGALMPSVLIETGYVSHDGDARNLGSDAGRKSIARQIARSIDEFRRASR